STIGRCLVVSLWRIVEDSMITWNKSKKKFETTPVRQSFDDDVYQRAISHAQSMRGSCLTWGDSWLTSYDLAAARANTNAGMDLCHQVSISLIERIIVKYLNGEIDF